MSWDFREYKSRALPASFRLLLLPIFKRVTTAEEEGEEEEAPRNVVRHCRRRRRTWFEALGGNLWFGRCRDWSSSLKVVEPPSCRVHLEVFFGVWKEEKEEDDEEVVFWWSSLKVVEPLSCCVHLEVFFRCWKEEEEEVERRCVWQHRWGRFVFGGEW
jgi:hypothetical protein